MSYLRDGGEKSMRRLGFVWAMTLFTISLLSYLFLGIIIDTQIFVILGGIASVAIGATAVKNKSPSKTNSGDKIPFD